MNRVAFAAVLIFQIIPVFSLDNGLALTPPMGWMSWQRFRCTIDCTLYPNDCISEKLFHTMADRLVEDGYLEAGYEYLIVDDCWLATERDSEGRLQPDPKRFPSGMKSLGDYIHSKGLKFGLYEDYGTKTCAGYPGIIDHMELDAQTFAEWGVDYIKLDGCYAKIDSMEQGYALMGQYLNQTGRPMVYSCSYPAYQSLKTNYSLVAETCNLWRNYYDIDDSWDSVQIVVRWFADNEGYINSFAGPGHWNDPDMLVIGNFGLSYDQSVAQMTLWTVLAAPLLMSNDLRSIRPEFRSILLNTDAIRINQDRLGKPGYLYLTINHVAIWIRPIAPQINFSFSYAFGLVNFVNGGTPTTVKIVLSDFGLDNENGYVMSNIFEDVPSSIVFPTDNMNISVNPSGAVLLEFKIISDVKEEL